MADWMYKRIDLTQYVTVPIWYGCNNNCTICMLAGMKQELPLIDFEAFKSLVTGIKSEGKYENLVLSGAEVTTFPDLVKYVRHAASLGWFKKIQIQTNGRRLSDRVYLENLIDTGVNEFFISIQGLEETHDAITRTRGSFKETMEAVRNLGLYDVNVISNTVLTKANFPDIVPLMALLSKEAFSEIHLWNFFPMESMDSKDLLVRMKDFRDLLPQVLSSLKNAKKPFVLKNFPECLSIGENGFFDSGLPMTLIDEAYWRRFRENRFGSCLYRDRCDAKSCWGLSGAYVRKFGDERDLVLPIRKGEPESDAGIGGPRGSLEYTTEQDVFFDYCLYEYKPAVPFENKLRSVNVLFQTFDVFKIHEKAFDLVRVIREGIGLSWTVWGVKQQGNNVAWEFYFYDYRRLQRERSITKILETIRPLIPCRIQAIETQPYFMFSIDIDSDLLSGKKDLDEIHMYIGNTASNVSSGISYSLTARGRKLENFYFFFDPKTEMKGLLNKVFCSAHVDPSRITIDQVVWPELRSCKRICAANKQNSDCIYFSGINVDQFIFFLKRLNYPGELSLFVEENRSALDHLQYDVGFDYRTEGNEVIILKSGYYGFF